MERIAVLDHGYVELVETYGSDESIICAARMSVDKGFLGWEPGPCEACSGTGLNGRCRPCEGKGKLRGDKHLLRFLWEKKHATPFEMAGAIIEVQAPIFVFREWHRHRTQCLAPDTLVHFERRTQGGKRVVHKMRIEDVWQKWQPTERADRPERQTSAYHKRQRIQGMSLRCMDEAATEFGTTHVTDVIKGEPKPMVRVTTASGRSVTATREHRVMTERGWMTLGEAINSCSLLTLEGTTREKAQRWERPAIRTAHERWLPVAGWEGVYEVSNEGRVRRIDGTVPSDPKRNTAGAQGYDVVSLSRGGKTYTFTVHTLVLRAFEGPCPEGMEARHLDDNRANPSRRNLEWGTPKRNAQDRIDAGRQQRLVPNFEQIVSVEDVGSLPTYDLSVEGPYHNFVADGFVVHNSYNEMSARYAPLPDVNYVPTVERIMRNASKSNKQAGTVKGSGEMTEAKARQYIDRLHATYADDQAFYEDALLMGIPKELARIHLPVGRYSKMRAHANLRNWLGFLTLRKADDAQWEIHEYANAAHTILTEHFPRTLALFDEGMAHG